MWVIDLEPVFEYSMLLVIGLYGCQCFLSKHRLKFIGECCFRQQKCSTGSSCVISLQRLCTI